MEKPVDVVDLISNLLDNGKYKEALAIPNDEKYRETFRDNCCDLVPILADKIDNDTAATKPSLQGACEELLSTIIQKCSPEEAILQFIEQIEIAKNAAQFSLSIVPLQLVLKKLKGKRASSLQWCLNSIKTYIQSIPTPDYQLEQKELLLLDSDTHYRSIVKAYTQIPIFCKPFIQELEGSTTSRGSKEIIAAFLISLLGKPVIYIDLGPDVNAESEARQSCTLILNDVCILEKNVCKFLEHVEICKKEESKKNHKSNEEDIPQYSQRDNINMTTLSGLFYCVFSGHFSIPEIAIPQVYSIEYIVHTSLICVIHLLSFTEFGPLYKAVALCKALVNRLSNNTSSNILSVSYHFEAIRGLANVAIYSTYESIRKDSVQLIGNYVNKFEYTGRIKVIKSIIDNVNHSGMISYAISLYKNTIVQGFSEKFYPECLRGIHLLAMVKKICFLPFGAESDLVELSDQIITALNFIRYLSLKDTENVTGIKECFQYLEDEYISKLRMGLNMSKAHYEVKLKDIEDGVKQPKDKINVSVIVGGNNLDQIPVEQKKEIILSALNAFHLIEGLVARVSECIILNKNALNQ